MEYLVSIIKKQNVLLYRIRAETAELALSYIKNYKPFKEYNFVSIYGNGEIAIPYTTVNVALTYIKLLFAQKKLSFKENTTATYLS